ncbi:MAG TPA: hypothetical protein VFI02_18700 [Armatimonadota bacterium]|nr:hypothetical protein [Armatimonadota bacterium]
MSNVSQAGAFDAEIIETSRRIEHLVQESAPYAQIEEEQYKLSCLMNQKQAGLYQPKDPSYYVDQFLRCLSPEDRRAKAAEFAEGALASINAMMESDDQLDPDQLETFISVIEFFRYYAPKDEESVYDAAGDGSADLVVPELPEILIEANAQCKITPAHLADALVEHGYLTEENARLFRNRLSGRTSHFPGSRLSIVWQGDIHSAATMFTLASNLNILNLGSKKNPNSAEQRTTVAAAVLHTFSFSLPRPLSDKNYTKLLYRHTQEAKDSVETFYDAVETVHANQAHNQNLGKDDKDRKAYKPLKTTEDLIGGYYSVNTIRGVGEGIRNQCRYMDFEMLDLFNDLIMNED